MADKDKSDKSKQPFVAQADRPEVRIDLDMPINELRVRDLAAILGLVGTHKSPFEGGKTPIKDFFDKPFPEETKDFLKEIKIEKIEKPEKPEKVEKNEKFEKPEKIEKHEKHEKHEKPEKHELKELKLEKIENDGVFDPGPFRIPDPRLDAVIQAISGLTAQVSQLANQLEELRKKTEG